MQEIELPAEGTGFPADLQSTLFIIKVNPELYGSLQVKKIPSMSLSFFHFIFTQPYIC